ncbi:MAG: hypothetical protein L0177_06615 [Chloroflexi bacterium]|nr:hypothetical protein [Chloroflexota bacterium]
MASKRHRLDRLERERPLSADSFGGICVFPPRELLQEALAVLVEAGAIQPGDVPEVLEIHRQCLEALYCEKHNARLKPYDKWGEGAFYHPA